MRNVLFLAAALTLISAASPALAHEANRRCPADPQAIWISENALRAQIEGMGYDVRRLKTRHGCFEAYLVNRENGGAVKAISSAATGELARASLASEGRERDAAH